MATIDKNTYVTNFNADGQNPGIELMTDERGHMYPVSHLFQGSTVGDALAVVPPESGGSGLSVQVLAGYVQIPYDDYAYLGWLDTDSVLNIEADTSSGSRYVAIVAYIDRSIQYSQSETNKDRKSVV